MGRRKGAFKAEKRRKELKRIKKQEDKRKRREAKVNGDVDDVGEATPVEAVSAEQIDSTAEAAPETDKT